MEYCSFCEILVSNLRNGDGFFKEFSEEIREELLNSMNPTSPVRDSKKLLKELGPLNDVNAFCRGFGLCPKHADTIKRDNKIRAKKGMSMPSNLKIIGKLRLYDWVIVALFAGLVLI